MKVSYVDKFRVRKLIFLFFCSGYFMVLLLVVFYKEEKICWDLKYIYVSIKYCLNYYYFCVFLEELCR